jgi:hypothetical protein
VAGSWIDFKFKTCKFRFGVNRCYLGFLWHCGQKIGRKSGDFYTNYRHLCCKNEHVIGFQKITIHLQKFAEIKIIALTPVDDGST